MCESLSILNTLSAASAAADSSWVETFSSGMENLNPNAPFSEKLLYGLKIALIGIVVVFLILAIIWAVLFVFNLIFKNCEAGGAGNRTGARAEACFRRAGRRNGGCRRDGCDCRGQR